MNFTCIARTHGAPAVPADREEWERLRGEPWLAEMCRRIEAGEEVLKHRLPIWTPHCKAFANNHRSIKDALEPLQRLMLDFDDKGHSAEIMEKALQLQEEGKWQILLIEDSVRRGTHVLISLPQGMTAEEAQTRFSQDVGFQADGVVKDVSRCIYMVPTGHTLYVSEELFNEELRTKNEEFLSSCQPTPAAATSPWPPSEGGTPGEIPLTKGAGGCSSSKESGEENSSFFIHHSSFPTSYQGMDYQTILETLEDQMGGTPELGSRNNFIFAMACHLRYICDDNPDWIATILPTYGEDREKWMQTIRSACNRSQTKQLSRVIQRTLSICKKRQEEESGELIAQNADTPPPMPEVLPPLIRLLTSRTPDIYRPAVAHAVFPALGAHLWRTTFRYIDNVEHEATLMNVLMAGTGAGKNCISEPVNRILADIRKSDRENRQREKEWKAEMQTKGSNKDKRQRPDGLVIQEIDPDVTNAAFVQRLSDAEERFLYAKMNELDQFDALKTSARSQAHFQIMCLAFDPGNIYGQTRASTASVSERVCIRFNWNASTTIRKGQAYFRHVLTDGPISRINFCTIPEQPIGAEMPIYGTYDADFDEELRPYIERLTKARGLVECVGAQNLARRLRDENAEFARLSQSRVYENLSFRANVIAYLKAMVLFVAHGGVWDEVMEEFVRWSLQYDMWCKMHFFGEAIEEVEYGTISAKKRGPQNLLDLLPDTFSREEAQQMRLRQGVKQGTVGQMLSTWKKRDYIELVDENVYTKTEHYLKKVRR